MTDPVAEYLRLEARLLAHRCAERLTGRAPSPEDPFEIEMDAKFEALWNAMTAEQRRELHALRDARSAPWFAARDTRPDEDSPHPALTGLPPRRRADPFRGERLPCT